VSSYQFPPAIAKGRNPSFAWWENAFTDEEIEQIKEYAKTLFTTGALLDNEKTPPPEQTRKAKVSWISNTPEALWIYDRMAFVARELNSQYYNFDLYGFLEDMQFTIYEETNAHYTWHIDMGDASKAWGQYFLG